MSISAKQEKRFKKLIEMQAIGFSQREIARRANISQSQVSRDMKKIMKLFRKGRLDVDVTVRIS